MSLCECPKEPNLGELNFALTFYLYFHDGVPSFFVHLHIFILSTGCLKCYLSSTSLCYVFLLFLSSNFGPLAEHVKDGSRNLVQQSQQQVHGVQTQLQPQHQSPLRLQQQVCSLLVLSFWSFVTFSVLKIMLHIWEQFVKVQSAVEIIVGSLSLVVSFDQMFSA